MKRITRTLEEKTIILKKSDCKCAHCGVSLDTRNMTLEHVFPLSRGGEDIMDNLVALCFDCNAKKNNFTFLVNEYYSFLLPKHMDILSDYSDRMCFSENYPLGNATRLVYTITDSSYNFLTKKQNRKNTNMLLNKTAPKMFLSQVYPNEAKEILDFIIKSDTYTLKKIYGKEAKAPRVKDEWLALKTIENAIKYDRVYAVTNVQPGTKNSFLEYKTLYFFSKLKDLTVLKDPDGVLKNINIKWVFSSAILYKYPASIKSAMSTLGQYCYVNNSFVPILETMTVESFAKTTLEENDKYSFVMVDFKNTEYPIPTYENYPFIEDLGLVFFFRVPKCFICGQPMSRSLYKSVARDSSIPSLLPPIF